MRKKLTKIWKNSSTRWKTIWAWVNRFGLRSRYKRYQAVARWSLHRHKTYQDLAAKAKKNGNDKAAKKLTEQAQTFAKAFHFAHHRYQSLKQKWEKKHQPHPAPQPSGNIVVFDGHSCPAWIVRILQAARNSGAWHGSVNSGFRTPEYSQSLCCSMCGACSMGSTCPGTCAGIYSNHACPPSHTCAPYEGAVDVSDYYNLERYCRNVGAPLFGAGYALPYDLVHFSHTGR
jgi:hypothetical protein